MVGVLDFGIGNIGSVVNMLKKGDIEACAVQTAGQMDACNKLILPGVGAFDAGMALLTRSGLRPALDQAVAQGKPVLGICLGMQLLGRSSEEGVSEGLGYLPFSLKRLSAAKEPGLKIPHMGWDDVSVLSQNNPLVQGLEAPSRFYFVHSYYAQCEDNSIALMECEYGSPFVAAVHQKNIWGVQFHPEKSHRFGLRLLKNFAKEC